MSRARALRRSARLLLAALVFTTGCVGYTVKPEKPASMPRADAQVPLTVGVALKQSYEWKGFGMDNRTMERFRNWGRMKPIFQEADHVGDRFVKALDDSRGFSSVTILPSASFGPAELETHDVIIDAEFKSTYQQDPAMFAKAFLTGFLLLLPAPFVRYDDTFTAAADLSLYDSGGGLVRKLSDKAEATTSAALFSAGMPSQITAGISSSAENLAAKLVTAVLADRESLRQIGGRHVARRAKVQPEPDPEVAAAVADAEKAAAAAAAAQQRVARLKAAHDSEAPAATAVAPAAAQPAAAADLAEGPSRASLPKRGGKIRVTDAEASAELLP